MPEAQTLGEAVRSANKELTAKPESQGKPERSESRESTERQDVEREKPAKSEDDDYGAPKWTQQRTKPFKESLRKLYSLEGGKDLMGPVLKEFEEQYANIGPVKEGFDRYKKQFSRYENILPSLEQRFIMQGVDPAVGIQQMAAVADLLEQNPDQGLAMLAQRFRPRDAKVFLQQLAQQYGVDLGGLVAQEPWLDPAVKQFVQPLQQQIQNLTGVIQSNQQQQAQHYQRQIEYNGQVIAHHLKAFREAQDEAGNLKYPDHEVVEPIMARMITSGYPVPPDVLNGPDPLGWLYNEAVWQVPQLREKRAEQQARAAEAKAIKDAAVNNAHVEEAQRASRNVNGATKAPKQTQRKSLSETIRANHKRLSN